MNPGPHERDLPTLYLLGYLPEEDREEVAGRMFADDQFAEALEDAERDLLDAYARGHLNPQDRAAVVSRLLNSERQMEKLQFATALARRSQAPKGWPVQRLLLWAAAAVLVLSATGIWLRKSATQQTSAKAPVVHAPVQTPAPVFAALLSSGGLRDGEIQEVTLPQHAELVRLDLQLEGSVTSANYSVRLVRQRETVLEVGGLEAHIEVGTPVLSVVLGSAVLSPGQYRLLVNPTGMSYYFKVRQ